MKKKTLVFNQDNETYLTHTIPEQFQTNSRKKSSASEQILLLEEQVRILKLENNKLR